MTQAKCVHSTPPTNTSALPVDPTRRRFLAVAAVGSVASAGSLAAAALTPSDVPQAVTVPKARPFVDDANPAFDPAARKLSAAHKDWTAAREVFEAVMAPVAAWETLNPLPDSNRKRKKWRREHNAVSYTQPINAAWVTQVEAENAYRAAQMEVAQIPAITRADILLKACLAATYDGAELSNRQEGIIAFSLATDIVRLELDLGKAVQS
jgi:hypothetical protein